MNKKPKIGQKIYIPSSLYVYRGKDDFAGGIATISKIEYSSYLPKDDFNYTMIGIEEKNGTMYNWKYLIEKQDKLKKQYKDQIAHPDPDYRKDFNCHPNTDWKQI